MTDMVLKFVIGIAGFLKNDRVIWISCFTNVNFRGIMEPVTDYIIYSGQAIREMRRARGWDIEQFAKLIQVSSGHVSNFETGKRFPRTNELQRIKEVLGKPILII